MFHALILASKILPKPDLSGNTDKILLHGLVPDEIERENHLTTGDEIARVKDEIVEDCYVINALNEDCNRGNALGSVGKDTIEVRARESVHEDCEEKYVLSHEDNGFTEEIVFKNISFREETTPTSNDVIIVEETLNSNNNRRNNTNHLVNTVEGSPNLVIIVNSNKDKVNHPLDHTLEDDTHDVDTTVNKDNAVELNLNLKRNTDNNFEHIDIVGENRRTCVKECESDTDQTNNIPELSDDTPHLPETVSDVFFVQTGEIINPVVEHTSGNMLDNLAMKLYGEKIRHRVRLSVESEPSSATKNLNHDFGVDINGNSNRKACSLEKTESDYMDNFMYQSFRIEVTEDKEKFGKDKVSEIEAFSKNKENEIEAFIEDILIEAFENAKQTGALDSPNVTDNFTHYHFLDIREDIEYDSEKKVVNNDDESNENDAEIKRYPTNLTDISNCHSVLGTRNGTDGDSEKESCQNEFGANTEPNIVGTDGVNHERKSGEHHNKNNKTEQEELTDGKVTYKMIHIEDITDEIDESSVARNDIKGKEYKIKSNEDIPNRTNTNDTKTADLTNTVGPKEASLDTPNRENKHLTKTILAQETNAGLPHRVNTNNIAKTNDVNAKTTPSRVNKSGITKTVDANMKDMFDRNRLIRESKQSSGALDKALRITRNNLSWIECTGEDADKQSNVQRVNRVTETGDDSRYVRINHDDRSDNENQINTRSSCSAGSRNFGLYGHSENVLKRDSARNQIYRETEINSSENVIKRNSASNKIYRETEINSSENVIKRDSASNKIYRETKINGSENVLKRDSASNKIYRETEINGSENVIKRDSASNKIYLETEINGYERTNTSCSGQTVIDAIGDANTGTLSRSYHEETSRSYKESDKIEPRIPIYQETRNPSDGSVNSETQSRIHQESRRNSSKTGSYGSCQDARSNSNEYVKPKYQSLRESRRNSHKTGSYGSCQDTRSNSKENIKPKYTSLREAWFHDDVERFIRDSISNNTNSSCSWDGNSDHGSTAGKSDDSNVFGYPAYKFKAGDNHHFHPTCAKCSKCGDLFGDGEEMFVQGGAIWHPKCGPGPLDASTPGGGLKNGDSGHHLNGHLTDDTAREFDRMSSSAASELQFAFRSRTPSFGSIYNPNSLGRNKYPPYSARAGSPGLLLREYGTTTPGGGGSHKSYNPEDISMIHIYSYLTEEPTKGYLRRPIDPYDKPPTSPHFHRPHSSHSHRASSRSSTRMSGSRSGMKALVESYRSETPRSKSPHMNNEEPINLAHFPAAKPPHNNEVPKIERDDFPAPPYPYSDPERRRRWSDSYKGVPVSDDEDEVDNVEKNGHGEPIQKLKKEEEELSKIASGIGKVFLKQVQDREKLQKWKQSHLDPRNASRTPSATKEPVYGLRYQSPVNASPSRNLDAPRPWEEDEFDRASSYRSSVGRSTGAIHSYNVVSSLRNVPKPGYTLAPHRSHTFSSAGATSQTAGDFSLGGLGDKTHSTNFSSGKSDVSNGSIYDLHHHHHHHHSHHNGGPGELPVSSTYAGSLGYAASYSNHIQRSLPNMSGPLSLEPPKIYPYHLLIITNYRLPPDVDRKNLERHLSDAEFETLFLCTRAEFYRMPQWRRNEIKKRARLF